LPLLVGENILLHETPSQGETTRGENGMEASAFFEQSSQVKREADAFLDETKLLSFLQSYGTVQLAGSYALDPMVNRDIDREGKPPGYTIGIKPPFRGNKWKVDIWFLHADLPARTQHIHAVKRANLLFSVSNSLFLRKGLMLAEWPSMKRTFKSILLMSRLFWPFSHNGKLSIKRVSCTKRDSSAKFSDKPL
jgi:hypothetical protein